MNAVENWCRHAIGAVTLMASAALLCGGAIANSASGGPTTEQLQVVLDTSASVPVQYRIEALKALAAVARSWPRPLPANGRSALEHGLLIQVRGVSADSYAPESVLGTWNVRSIPGVAGLPANVTSDFTQRVLRYKREHQAAVVAYKGAVRDARRAANALAALRPATTYASEIQGAVSAAAQSFSPGGLHRLIVVSDLAQNRPPEIAGDLHGVRVLIGHICWNVSRCQLQELAWSRSLRSRGAAAVTFARVERLPYAITKFVGRA